MTHFWLSFGTITLLAMVALIVHLTYSKVDPEKVSLEKRVENLEKEIDQFYKFLEE